MSKISVITVCYNAENEIEKTLLSVIKQTFNNFEYIVVDGKSSDRTMNYINKYSSYITKIISEPDSGIYNAMNKAVHLSSGEYCIFMNAGDTFAGPDVLKQVSNYLNGDFDILIGNEISTKNGKIVDYSRPPLRITPVHLYRSSLSHQSSFIKRSLLLKYPYDENLKLVSDWKFWIETLLIKNYKYSTIDIDVCFFNQDGSTYNFIELGKSERMKTLEECMPESMLIDCKKEIEKNNIKWFLFRIRRKLKRYFFLLRASNYNQEWYYHKQELFI